MRAVEREFVRRRSEESRRAMAAELERHRLAYVYFLNRLVDADRPHELVDTARQARRHRAVYMRMSEAESDRMCGSVWTWHSVSRLWEVPREGDLPR